DYYCSSYVGSKSYWVF
nr:immunoglobulin light chain junction region [Macaca mulatta]MOW27790.1 immunoglobulin light chain junction region [Macaca mulatta]MOW28193.1 immunoglobulin light chain junction region [Macaca mulatta]MOW28290.1 immunoglobulin light chain junction region [Macaca mulatta]MOW28640.1 immunoglobulin light chain junction region [Macaca mulatta]